MSSSVLVRVVRLALIAVVVSMMSVLHAAPVLAGTTEYAEIGAPFAGKWAYNVNVNPPYSDANSSHPGYHLISGGGDFATDYYGAQGQDVRLRINNASGALSFAWGSSSTSCGTSTLVNVYVDGQFVGRIYIAHLVNAVSSGPITNGMVLGKVGNFGCAPGQHIHIEVKADGAGNFACYQDYGHPGTPIGDNAKFAGMGSTGATGIRQACNGGGGGSVADGTFVAYGGHVYRIAGGAPLYVSSWNVFGGSQPTTGLSDPQFNALRAYPADGTLVSAANGAVYVFAGGAPLYVSDFAAIGGQAGRPVTYVDQFALDHAGEAAPTDHTRKYPVDGAAVSAAAGAVYIFAGGAPLYTGSWAAVGGERPTTRVDQAALDTGGSTAFPWGHVRKYPFDGTAVTADQGAVYIFAGGAPLYTGSWAAVGGPRPTTQVHQAALDTGGSTAFPWGHVRKYPLDGTAVVADQGAVYVFAGGAPLYVGSWAAIGGERPTTRIHQAALDAGGTETFPWGHVRKYPLDGTGVVTQTAKEFVFAGGAGVAVSNWSAIGGRPAVVAVDNAVFANAASAAFPYGHARRTPQDGAVLKFMPSATSVLFSGGTCMVTSRTPSVSVNDGSITCLKIVNTSRPTISGKAKVGRRLTASPGSWSVSGLKVTYQWFRSSKAIPGASGTSYKCKKRDQGKRIHVVVTVGRNGYFGSSAASDAKKVR